MAIDRTRSMWVVLLAAALLGCSTAATEEPGEPGGAVPGKSDTGWVADTSFEVGASFAARVSHAATGTYEGLATDRALQERLVDEHIKFGKTGAAKNGYHLNQLAESVVIENVEQEGDIVTITYVAKVDLVRGRARGSALPALEDLPHQRQTLTLPADPVGIYSRTGRDCVRGYEGHSVSEQNVYYYFAPDNDACSEPMTQATLLITGVYPERKVYPEYDRLLSAVDGADNTFGFRAAILPNYGDGNLSERFDRHKRMLEDRLRLEGTPADDGAYVRYLYERKASDESTVRITIDLYDPTKSGGFTTRFRKALGEYQLVFYNGHSQYGTQPFLTEADAFSDQYQIVMMHSCRSYPYYARQIFRAKATQADRTGFVAADVVATGESSYATDSPYALQPLLEKLLQGIVAAREGGERARRAPDWIDIVREMNDVNRWVLYGAAGVRANAWQPQ
ncbi:MAG: hypothetical protein KC503_44520 [Myxococcales bacterium]|nr:hypothetical protein [Myxococcales bacterium]